MYLLRSRPRRLVRLNLEKRPPLRAAPPGADLRSTTPRLRAAGPPVLRNKIYAARYRSRSGCRRLPGRRLRPAASRSQRPPARTRDVPAGTLPKSSTAPLARTPLLQPQPARATSAEIETFR